MIPRSGEQVEILSAVSEIMQGRTQQQTVEALMQRFGFVDRQRAELRVEQAQRSIELGEALGAAPAGTPLAQVSSLLANTTGSRFVKVEIQTDAFGEQPERREGLTNYLQIHIPYTEGMSREELQDAIDSAVDDAAGDDHYGLTGSVIAVNIVGVF